MIQIGSRYVIKDITGMVMGFAKEKRIVILWDGKKNHRLKLEGKITILPDEPEPQSVVRSCGDCYKDKPLNEYQKFKNGNYKKMCNECLEKSAMFRKMREEVGG